MRLEILIKKLQILQKELAELNPLSPEVLISSDEEGNSYGKIDIQASFGYDENSNTLVIYPVNSQSDF